MQKSRATIPGFRVPGFGSKLRIPNSNPPAGMPVWSVLYNHGRSVCFGHGAACSACWNGDLSRRKFEDADVDEDADEDEDEDADEVEDADTMWMRCGCGC